MQGEMGAPRESENRAKERGFLLRIDHRTGPHVRGRKVARALGASSRARRFALALLRQRDPGLRFRPRLETAIHMRDRRGAHHTAQRRYSKSDRLLVLLCHKR
jgi:hypothetical protein